MTNRWKDSDHSRAYLQRKDNIPRRGEGEACLLEEIPKSTRRILDLGCGDGHLLRLTLEHCPNASGVGIDFSTDMLDLARRRTDENRAEFQPHDLNDSLLEIGSFDCVVSSFAIHHCEDERKKEIYREVLELLEPGGVFCNLEHVASPTPQLHLGFLESIGVKPEEDDPSNKLLAVETQAQWLRELGFENADCVWKWRELALLTGRKPELSTESTDLEIICEPAPADIQVVVDRLEAFNQLNVGRDDFQSNNYVLRMGDQSIGGLKSLTGWDWLYVQNLWVDEQFRGQGWGERLLEQAESESKKRGCLGACLSSFSFQAPKFYQKFGYQVFGTIEDYPPGQTLYFLSKRF